VHSAPARQIIANKKTVFEIRILYAILLSQIDRNRNVRPDQDT
jgi:hypothetical protein